MKNLTSLGQKTWEKAKNIMPGGICCFQKSRFILPKNGQHILVKLKMIYLNGTKHDDFLMGVEQMCLVMLIKKLMKR